MGSPDDSAATGTFWDHLDALRGCLLKAAVVVASCGVAAFFFKDALFRIVLAPKDSDFCTYRLLGWLGREWGVSGMVPGDFSVRLINTALAEQFVIHMKVSLYAGLLCASPYVIYVLFRFVSPALYDNERRYAVRTVGAGYVMFLLGTALNYFLIFPLTFRFLGTYQVSAEVENTVTLQSYMNTLLMMSLTLGIVFEIPVLCWLLARFGVLTSSFMRRFRRHAVVVVLVAAAVITPTSDVFTLLLVAFPMWLLYEAGIWVVAATEKGKGQVSRAAEAGSDAG